MSVKKNLTILALASVGTVAVAAYPASLYVAGQVYDKTLAKFEKDFLLTKNISNYSYKEDASKSGFFGRSGVITFDVENLPPIVKEKYKDKENYKTIRLNVDTSFGFLSAKSKVRPDYNFGLGEIINDYLDISETIDVNFNLHTNTDVEYSSKIDSIKLNKNGKELLQGDLNIEETKMSVVRNYSLISNDIDTALKHIDEGKIEGTSELKVKNITFMSNIGDAFPIDMTIKDLNSVVNYVYDLPMTSNTKVDSVVVNFKDDKSASSKEVFASKNIVITTDLLRNKDTYAWNYVIKSEHLKANYDKIKVKLANFNFDIGLVNLDKDALKQSIDLYAKYSDYSANAKLYENTDSRDGNEEVIFEYLDEIENFFTKPKQVQLSDFSFDLALNHDDANACIKDKGNIKMNGIGHIFVEKESTSEEESLFKQDSNSTITLDKNFIYNFANATENCSAVKGIMDFATENFVKGGYISKVDDAHYKVTVETTKKSEIFINGKKLEDVVKNVLGGGF